MEFYNKIEIAGRITSFSGVKSGASSSYCFGKISTFDKGQKKHYPINIGFIAFDEVADNMEDVEEGSIIKIIGYLKLNKYKETSYFQVVIKEFEFLNEEDEPRVEREPKPQQINDIPEDDFPF